MSKPYKPGQKATASGQYELLTSSGKLTGVERTVVKGEPLPPTPKANMSYVLSDRTKTR